ncbi:MAG: Uma2 family endonuclease [Steroidobacteraceae bacterium]
MTDWLPRHRISANEYHRMGELGFFGPEERVELIDGQVIDMAPIGLPHMAAVDRLTRVFVRTLGESAIVRIQGSVTIEEFSEPQPDLTVLKPRDDFYRTRYANASDTLLVIEVSDTTWRYDRHVKLPLYARCGIPEFWIVDVQRGALHRFHGPSADGYAESTSTESPGVTPIRALPDFTVNLSGLFAS